MTGTLRSTSERDARSKCLSLSENTMRSGLQRKLTLSHLIVTLISVVILAALILGGYLIYLQTDLPALWAGDQAYFIAEDIAYFLDGDHLTEETAEDIIFEFGFIPISDFDEVEDIFYEDWIIIFSPDGGVIGSNDAWRYSPGSAPDLGQLPGFDMELFQTNESELISDDPWDLVAYAVEGQDHIGQAAIISFDNEHLGWVYYRAGGVDAPFSSSQTITALAIVLVGSALIAALVSGIAGGWLSLSFSRRLQTLSQASADLAAGNLSSRVPVNGEDEIDRLGDQFNAMADQLESQMIDLRSLAERNAMLAEEASALASVEERNRLARELHDAIKQQIFALSLTANSIRLLLDKNPGLATERLEQLETQARDVHLEMDAIIKQLRPASLGDRGLAPALKELADKWQEQHQIPVSWQVQGERELPLPIEQALYRISQEALNNIARHADAIQVSINLRYSLEQLVLEITDNGKGFDTRAIISSTSLGLDSMKERAAEINGNLEISSKIGQGSQLTLAVPID